MNRSATWDDIIVQWKGTVAVVELDSVTYIDDGVDDEDKLLIDVQKRSNSDRNKICDAR